MEFLSILPTAYYTFPMPGYVRFAEHAPYRSGLGLGLGLGLGFSGCFHLIRSKCVEFEFLSNGQHFLLPRDACEITPFILLAGQVELH